MNEKKFTEVFNKYNRLVRKMVISRSGNDMLAEVKNSLTKLIKVYKQLLNFIGY